MTETQMAGAFHSPQSEEVLSARGCLYELGVDYGALIGLANHTENGHKIVDLFRKTWEDVTETGGSFYDIDKILSRYHQISPEDPCDDKTLTHQFHTSAMSGYDMITSFLRSCAGGTCKNPFDESPYQNGLEIIYVQLGLHNLFGDQNDDWVRRVQKYLLEKQIKTNLQIDLCLSPSEMSLYTSKGRFLNADTLVLIRNRNHLRLGMPAFFLFVSDESGYTGDVFMDVKTEEDVFLQMAAVCNHAQMQSLFRNASVCTSGYDGIDMHNIDRFSRDKSLDKCMQAASYGCSFYQFLKDRQILCAAQREKNLRTVTFCGMTNVDHAEINLQNPKDADILQFDSLYRNLQTVSWGQRVKNQMNALLPKLKGAFDVQRKEGDWEVYQTSLHGTACYKAEEQNYRITDNTVRKEHTDLTLQVLEDNDCKEFLLLAAPGIGKTYTVRQYIKQKGKGIFVYISPRIAITQEVVSSVEKDYGERGLVLTTDCRMGVRNICAGANEVSIAKGQKAAGCDENGNAYRLLTEAMSETVRDAFSSAYNIEARTYNQGVLSSNNEHERVLDRLCGCAGNIALYEQSLAQNGQTPELSNLMLGISTQACGKISSSDLLRNILKIFGIPELPACADSKTGVLILPDEKIDLFLKTFQYVTFMVDEISGDEGGLQIRKALRKACDLVTKGSGGRIVPKLIIADASMQDKTTAQKYLGQTTPEAIFINPAEDHDNYLYAENAKKDSKIVNCCTYPAKNLYITYKANVSEQPFIPRQELKPCLAKIIQDVTEICRPQSGQREEMMCNDGKKRRAQCLIYIQNKADLEQIKSSLEAGEDPIRCMELTSDTSAAEKAKTQSMANDENAPEVLLITSSGARGLSFKYVTHLFIQIPTFSICSNLMEIMQTIYRGRGDRLVDSSRDKYLTFYLDLSYTKLEQKGLNEDEKKKLNQSLALFRKQKKIDMISMCLLVQSCVNTRILGKDKVTELSMTPLGRQGYTSSSVEIIMSLDKSIKKLERMLKEEKKPELQVIEKIVNAARAQSGDQYELKSMTDWENFHNFLSVWEKYAKKSLEMNAHPGSIVPFVVIDGCIVFHTTLESIKRTHAENAVTKEEIAAAKSIVPKAYKRQLQEVLSFLDHSSNSFDGAFHLSARSGHDYFLAIPVSSLGGDWKQSRWADIYEKQDMDIISCMATAFHQFANLDAYHPLDAKYGFEDVPFFFFSSADFPKRLETRFVNTELVTSTSINLLSLILGNQ